MAQSQRPEDPHGHGRSAQTPSGSEPADARAGPASARARYAFPARLRDGEQEGSPRQQRRLSLRIHDHLHSHGVVGRARFPGGHSPPWPVFHRRAPADSAVPSRSWAATTPTNRSKTVPTPPTSLFWPAGVRVKSATTGSATVGCSKTALVSAIATSTPILPSRGVASSPWKHPSRAIFHGPRALKRLGATTPSPANTTQITASNEGTDPTTGRNRGRGWLRSPRKVSRGRGSAASCG